MKAEVLVDAGICGFRTNVEADCADGQMVALAVSSGCEKIRGLGAALAGHGQFDAFGEIDPRGESAILALTRGHLKGCCAGCAVPVGVFKAMQVAANLALPKDISIQIKA